MSVNSDAGKKNMRRQKSRFSGLLLPLLALLVSAELIIGVYIYLGYPQVKRYHQVKRENELIKKKIGIMVTELDTLKAKLEMMERWEDEIRSRENYKEINKEIREMGIGGIPAKEIELINCDPEMQNEYYLLKSKLAQMSIRTQFNFETHAELRENIFLRDDIYRSTPSIYPAFGRLSSGYGYRRHPISGKRDFHQGIDISNRSGTPIYATADGEVIYVGRKYKMGKYIKIRHSYGFDTLYGHLSEYSVRKGQKVSKGDIIGRMGSTGESTGPHLHYEVIRYKRHRNPVKYLFQERCDIALQP